MVYILQNHSGEAKCDNNGKLGCNTGFQTFDAYSSVVNTLFYRLQCYCKVTQRPGQCNL